MSKLIPSPVRRCVQALIVTLMPVLVWAGRSTSTRPMPPRSPRSCKASA